MHVVTPRDDASTVTFPLTALQRGMLLDSLRARRDGMYVQQLVCTLREPLDVSTIPGRVASGSRPAHGSQNDHST